MSFGDRLRARREELNISRADLAESLGVSRSAIGNYETGISFPKEDVMLRLFDCLQVDPNYLYRDSFHSKDQILSHQEKALVEKYRSLSASGREVVRSVIDALSSYQNGENSGKKQERMIPLYSSPVSVGYATPVLGRDYDLIPVKEDVPPDADFAVRIHGDFMEPQIRDGSVVYVNRDPLKSGDVGIFCVDGQMLCRQYYAAPSGAVYLFILNREKSNNNILLNVGSSHTLVCFGKVMIYNLPFPTKL